MNTLSLGISPCPNDVYIFSGVIAGAVTLPDSAISIDYQDVETLNGRAQRGELDIVKISYANFARIAGAFELLSCGGALGRGCGPLLLTNGSPFDPEQEVLVPGEFTTANFLLDYYACRPLTKRFVAFDVLYEELRRTPGTQGVVIHEKRFTYAADGLTLVQDLGEHWEQQTGYAIPLGAIALKRAHAELSGAIENLVRRSLDWADRHSGEAFDLCREYAQDLDPAVIRAHIELYVNHYSRDLGPDGRAAVEYFLEQQRLFLSGAG